MNDLFRTKLKFGKIAISSLTDFDQMITWHVHHMLWQTDGQELKKHNKMESPSKLNYEWKCIRKWVLGVISSHLM